MDLNTLCKKCGNFFLVAEKDPSINMCNKCTDDIILFHMMLNLPY